jgi:hypothetical protein
MHFYKGLLILLGLLITSSMMIVGNEEQNHLTTNLDGDFKSQEFSSGQFPELVHDTKTNNMVQSNVLTNQREIGKQDITNGYTFDKHIQTLNQTSIDLDDGLWAYYDFNEGSGTTLIDRSGNGNDGTINGATYVGGIDGYALSFDGIYVDDFNDPTFGYNPEFWDIASYNNAYQNISSGETIIFSTGGHSFSGIVLKPEYSNMKTISIIAKFNTGETCRGNSFGFTDYSPLTDNWGWYYWHGKGDRGDGYGAVNSIALHQYTSQTQIYFNIVKDEYSKYSDNVDINYTEGFHNYTFQRTDQGIYFYIDSNLVSSYSDPENLPNINMPFAISSHEWCGGSGTWIEIDQVTMSTEVVSEPEPFKWYQIDNPTSQPAKRRGHHMAYDSTRGISILHGGYAYDQAYHFSDTWAFDHETKQWTSLKANSTGPLRFQGDMDYDPINDVFVSFGGITADGSRIASTYTYFPTNNTWKDMTPTLQPSARYDFRMVYHPNAQAFILHGGYGENVVLDDTWKYDFSTNTWTNLNPSNSIGKNYGYGMAYVDARDSLVVFGGDDGYSSVNYFWEYFYTNNTWREFSTTTLPEDRRYSDLAYSPYHNILFLHGGASTGGSPDRSQTYMYFLENDTWLDVTPTTNPGQVMLAVVIFDPLGQYFFLAMGQNSYAQVDIQTIWKYQMPFVAVEDSTPPEITSSPIDFTYEYGLTGNQLSWTVTSENPDQYYIYQNGVQIESNNWTTGTPISINIDGLALGIYNFTILLLDQMGNEVIHTVFITVEDTTSPIFTSSQDDFTYEFAATGNLLSWTVTDTHPQQYIIYRNGVQTISSSWASGIPISVNVDGLALGTYNYTILVSDTSGNNASHSVFVTVINMETDGTSDENTDIETTPTESTTEDDPTTDEVTTQEEPSGPVLPALPLSYSFIWTIMALGLIMVTYFSRRNFKN